MKVIKRAIVVLAITSIGFFPSACTSTNAEAQTNQAGTHSVVAKAKAKPSTTKVKAKACKHEDSEGPCYWNAKKRGNGKGMSFYVMPSGRIFYDVKKSKKDGYVNANWKIVCPKGWTLVRDKAPNGMRWAACM